MFGRFGWAEILVIVILVLILFGHNKIPGEEFGRWNKYVQKRNKKQVTKRREKAGKSRGAPDEKIRQKKR